MGAPIYGFVGPNGGGKTLCAVETLARPALERGRQVVSTCYIEGAYALESLRQLPELHGATILLDEITSCFPSRQSNTMPPEVARILNQLRKDDCVVAWTGPSWDRADKILREVTDQVTVCRSYLDGRPRAVRRAPDASSWPHNLLFRWRTYSVTLGDQFRVGDTTEGQRKGRTKSDMKPTRARWYRRPRDGSGAQSLYRTLDKVLLLDHLDEFGNCFQCGGTRRRPVCQGHSPTEYSAPRLRTWAEIESESFAPSAT